MTDAEILSIRDELMPQGYPFFDLVEPFDCIAFARAIEARLWCGNGVYSEACRADSTIAELRAEVARLKEERAERNRVESQEIVELRAIVDESVECYRALGRADSTISELQEEVARLREDNDAEDELRSIALRTITADRDALRFALLRARTALVNRTANIADIEAAIVSTDEALGGKT